jgi:ATP-dependent DNA ligase
MAGYSALDNLPPNKRSKLRKAKQPEWFAPMLATLTEQRFSREGWFFEPKLDGERCLVFRHPGRTELYSRNQKLLNAKYPELVKALTNQKTGCFIVDGEIVTFERGVTSFAKLQQRMQIQNPPAELRRRVPVWFYAFDLLYLATYDLRQVPLRYRKDLLKKTIEFEGPLRFTEHRETEGEAFYREACERQWEGIIAKNGDSTYVSERSRQWLKFKCINEQEFVITGYTDPQGERVGFGALLMARSTFCCSRRTGSRSTRRIRTRSTPRRWEPECTRAPMEGRVGRRRTRGCRPIRPRFLRAAARAW